MERNKREIHKSLRKLILHDANCIIKRFGNIINLRILVQASNYEDFYLSTFFEHCLGDIGDNTLILEVIFYDIYDLNFVGRTLNNDFEGELNIWPEPYDLDLHYFYVGGSAIVNGVGESIDFSFRFKRSVKYAWIDNEYEKFKKYD